MLLFTILYVEVKFWVWHYVEGIKLNQIQYYIIKNLTALTGGMCKWEWLGERKKRSFYGDFSHGQLWFTPQHLWSISTELSLGLWPVSLFSNQLSNTRHQHSCLPDITTSDGNYLAEHLFSRASGKNIWLGLKKLALEFQLG